MLKLIKSLGKLVVNLYFREAKKLDAQAKESAESAVFHAKASDKALKESQEAVAESAKLASQAQAISKFFK